MNKTINSKINNILFDTLVSRKYILEMLEKRNYDTSEYKTQGSEELKILFQTNSLDIVIHKNNDPNKIAIVKYLVTKPKIKINSLEKEISELLNSDLLINKPLEEYEIIILLKDKKSDSLQKVMDKCISRGIFIQLFWIKNLMYNPMEHRFVPKHEIISNDEYMEVIKKFNIQNNGIPIIYMNDPIAQYLGMRIGQVCKITRTSDTCGKYITYRICT